MLRKAVIPAAGLGTRLLSVTKEQPKEMLPVFARGVNGGLCLKPIVQLVFEQLFDVGFREFCFVVGRGKRAVEDHFTPDHGFVRTLERSGKLNGAGVLESFYKRVEGSTVVWVNQPEPLGFGDSVLRARGFVGEDRFLVHAGDTLLLSTGMKHLKGLLKHGDRLNADAIFLSQRVEDPRPFGVVDGEKLEDGLVRVRRVVEKPEKPASNLAIMPVYMFKPSVFKALDHTLVGKGGEVQLTDGVQHMVDAGLKVFAWELGDEGVRLDIGSPESYWEAQNLSFKHLPP